ncbi:rubrerythrin [Desulfovibrio intestinalis]|uniref:Rubrerythrin n=2 Tax=Desulfovibrio intestinalis TaxID=58621 RepID=A0A7W8FDQ3_9BACT|nr:rubrerythrin [Desulfovibrio intestinalis]
MMKTLKGSQTEKNILTAFAGESQARNRYDFFSAIAKKDGFVLVQEIFLETAAQEKEHAKRLFKFLEGGEVEIQAAYPAGVLAGSEANLLASAQGENYEHTEMYPSMAATAEKEGFSEVAFVMRHIAVAEAYHEKRFLKLASDIKEGRMFMRSKPTVWRCLNCGCLVDGDHAPDMCPACAHPKAFFEELNYSF